VLSFWSKQKYNLFVMLKISGYFSGKGLVTAKGFKGSFADAASSAKVIIPISLLDTHVNFICNGYFFGGHHLESFVSCSRYLMFLLASKVWFLAL
jgi:hypothetical protein